MTRITKDNLNYYLERLNKLTNGNFNIGYAYGGVKLESNEGSIDISQRLTKRELYYQLVTTINILESGLKC